MVCNAVVLPVRMYGIEAIPLTKVLESRVDYFQARCLRNILKKHDAHYSHASNKEVLGRVSEFVSEEPGKTLAASRQIGNRSVTLSGHVIRCDSEDPMRRVAIDAEFKRVEKESTPGWQTTFLLAPKHHGPRLQGNEGKQRLGENSF